MFRHVQFVLRSTYFYELSVCLPYPNLLAQTLAVFTSTAVHAGLVSFIYCNIF